MVFYAVANGRTNGIFLNWNDCNNSVKGFKNAIFKKFDTREEADLFIKLNSNEDGMKVAILPKLELTKEDDKTTDFIPDYYVYTDGACSNNGRDNALAGIGIFFGLNDIRNLSKKLEGKHTNNTAEIIAIIETYYIIEDDIKSGKNIAILSDSEYAIKCVSSYGEKCFNKGWDVNIPNRDLVKQLYDLYRDKFNVKFIHIRAHTNNTDIHSIGNFNADKLANQALDLQECTYNKISDKIYLNIPFVKKDEIKSLGGLWDSNKKKWFIYDSNKNKDLILTMFPSI